MINKERVKKYQKMYYSFPENKEKKVAYAKEWSNKNKDKIKEKSKEYYKNNKDKVIKYSRDYYNSPKGKEKRIRSTAIWKENNREKFDAYHKEYRNNPAYKKKLREKRLVELYKISLEEYENMFSKQNGLCAICNEVSIKLLAVDHNHITGKVRGLLCSQCNLAVGNVRERVDIIRSMLKYLS